MAVVRDACGVSDLERYGSVRLPLNLTAAGRFGLELTSFAWLDVMSPATKLPENSGLLHLLLEGLERPLDAIGVAELNLYHASSDDRIEKGGPLASRQAPGHPERVHAFACVAPRSIARGRPVGNCGVVWGVARERVAGDFRTEIPRRPLAEPCPSVTYISLNMRPTFNVAPPAPTSAYPAIFGLKK